MAALREPSALSGVDGLPELIGRLALVLRELEQTCSELQGGLGIALNAGGPLPSSVHERLQEIDRVTQTIDALAGLFSTLDAGSNDNQLDIAHAISQIGLHSVREQLQSAGAARPSAMDVEFF